MKYLIIFTLLASQSCFAQFELYSEVSGTYLLNGKVQFKEGLVDVGNNFGFDGSIGYIQNNQFGFELNYSGNYQTPLEFTSYSFTDHEDFSTTVDIHSISLNYLQYFENESIFTPILSLGSGTSIFNVRADNADDPVRFTLNFGGGTLIELNEMLSARVRVRYFAPLIFAGSGIHAGIGTGGSYLGMSIDASAPLAQLNFGAGFVFKLNRPSTN